MPAKGYCLPVDVADFLGVVFSAPQEVQAARLIESTEIDIDRYTNRGWLVGVQTAEAHRYMAYRLGKIYLRYVPVASIAEVRGRSGLGEAETVLVANEDYEIVSLEDGLIRLVSPGSYDRVTVDYTPVNLVPAPIRDACAEWVAARMMPHLRPDTYGLDSYSLPDLTVKFSRAVMGEGMPANVSRTLDLYRFPVAG
jgi:hypothetical protein